MGVFPSFLSVVQENAAISAELLGRAGEAGGDWRPKAACPARSYSAQGQPDLATRWDQQVRESPSEQDPDPKNAILQQGPGWLPSMCLPVKVLPYWPERTELMNEPFDHGEPNKWAR